MHGAAPHSWTVRLAVLALLGAISHPAAAEPTLADLSLEELLDTEVFSVSREDEGLMGTAAAVSVLTREDLRRSGASSVAEALRLVPGMHVSRINTSAWAISARGFAGRLANKMLVMVDGRSVYSPTFSGVHWETLDLVFEDIERIEVVRGPGGTMWGANAMNGVVNIITRDARDTRTQHVASGGGTNLLGMGTVRVGGGDEANGWRTYAKGTRTNGFDRIDGSNDHGSFDHGQVGFRLDRALRADTDWTLQGDVYASKTNEVINTPIRTAPYVQPSAYESELHGFNLLSELHLHGLGSWTLRTYLDDAGRDSPMLDEHRRTLDLDLQHASWIGGHSLMWGMGWRHQRTDPGETQLVTYVGDRYRSHWTAFVQDRKGLLAESLQVTAGLKVEGHTDDAVQWQPSIRLAWSVHPRRTTWAAASRAVRAPSSLERDIVTVGSVTPPSEASLGLPVELLLVPAGTSFGSETMAAIELGHREQVGSNWQFDLALYHHHYESLRAYTLLDPIVVSDAPVPYVNQPLRSANALEGQVAGAELGIAWQAHESWRLRAQYALTSIDLWPSDRSLPLLDTEWRTEEDSTPLHQLQFISWMALGSRWQLDHVITTYSRNRGQDVAPWVRWDARLGWNLSPDVELSVVGQNLLRSHHFEWGGILSEAQNFPGRAVFVGLDWRRD